MHAEPSSTDASEHLERLGALARQVGQSSTTAIQVYAAAMQSMLDLAGISVAVGIETAEGSQVLSGSLDESNGRVEIARYPIAVDTAMVLYHRSDDASLANNGNAHWAAMFAEEALECCAIAYLKDSYRTLSLPPTSKDSDTNKTVRRWSVIAIVALASMFVPVPFRISVEGNLVPADMVGIFAPVAGMLDEICVRDSETVSPGDILAIIDNPEIALQRDRLRGELVSTQTELASIRMSQSNRNARDAFVRKDAGGDGVGAMNRSTRSAVLKTKLQSLERQVELIDRIDESMTVRASQAGRVVLRDAQSEMVGQHVMQSQSLMQLANDSGGYRINLDVASDNFGYLAAIDPTSDNRVSNTNATFRLRSKPSVSLSGEISEVGKTVFYNEQGRGVIPVTVAVDAFNDGEESEGIHLGAPVVGHLSLGKRSLGFVLFRPLIESIRSWGW